MSIAKLMALSKVPIDYNDPVIQKKFADVRKRMAEFDKELEQRSRDRIPTQGQLNKVVDWGVRYG